ncbi:MAG: hypothetical protein IPL78_21385 [Chloroflexi bacterium]|nr:hypothetical protein [Chloroflexota bacterium]
MGFWLHVDIDYPDHDKESLPRFVHWGSSVLLQAFAQGRFFPEGAPSPLDKVAKKLGIDVSPLQKVSGGDFNLCFEGIDPEDKVAWAKAEQEKQQAEREHEANWQNPAHLVACIRTLMKTLDAHPNIFTEVDISTDYYKAFYLSGLFRKELDELLRIIEWAEARNFRVRLKLV